MKAAIPIIKKASMTNPKITGVVKKSLNAEAMLVSVEKS